MKKSTILYALALVCFYLIISGYVEGPAEVGQYDCTGAETGLGNSPGCTCHSVSANTGISIAFELDSANVPTTNYTGGGSYTIKLTGTNNTAKSLPKFGFQIGSIIGSISQVTPTNGGTWTSPFPTNTHFTASSQYMAVGVVEHSTRLAPVSGSGDNGTVYSETINWTAPATGTGVVSFWAALNAVNANGSADAGDLWNTNHVVINEWPTTTGIASPEQDAPALNVYPNPASDYIMLDYTLLENADVRVDLYDLEGKRITTVISGKQISGSHHEMIYFSEMNLKSGVYFILLNTGDKVSSRKLIVQ